MMRPIPTDEPLGGERYAFPMSFAQQRLWLIDQLGTEASAYNIPSALHLRGPLDAAALERALAHVVARHEALRTTLGSDGDEPVQIVWSEASLRLPI